MIESQEIPRLARTANQLFTKLDSERQSLPRSRKARIHQDRLALARAFPACFTPPGSKLPKQALKINIHFDLLRCRIIGDDGQPLSATRLREALRDYCHGPKYRKALSAGAPRINLDGDVVGSVGAGEVPPYFRPVSE